MTNKITYPDKIVPDSEVYLNDNRSGLIYIYHSDFITVFSQIDLSKTDIIAKFRVKQWKNKLN